MNHSQITQILVVFLVGFAVACGASVEGEPPVESTLPNPDFSTRSQAVEPLTEEVFVDVERAAELIDNGALILDTRKKDAYAEGHLPGALHAPWSVFAHAELDGAYVETDPDRAEAAARALGISHDRPIVVYGDAISTSSARQAWQLELYGHSSVHILDGGFDAWAASEEVSQQSIEPTPSDFTIAWRPDLHVSGAEVEEALEGGHSVIFFDARSFPEYEGTDDRDNPRRGHIPGAVHYEWTNVYAESGQLRDRDEIRTELAEAGLLADDALIIPYCQGGFRSAVAYSVLRWLGSENAGNYDGSWFEYARANNLEVNTP